MKHKNIRDVLLQHANDSDGDMGGIATYNPRDGYGDGWGSYWSDGDGWGDGWGGGWCDGDNWGDGWGCSDPSGEGHGYGDGWAVDVCSYN